VSDHRDCRKIEIFTKPLPDLGFYSWPPEKTTGFVFWDPWSQRGADLEEVNLSCLDRLGLAIILFGSCWQVLFPYTLAVGLLSALV